MSSDPVVREFIARQRASSLGLIHGSMMLGLIFFMVCALRDVYQATTLPWGIGVALAWRGALAFIMAALVVAVKKAPKRSQAIGSWFMFLLLFSLSASAATSQNHLSNLMFPVVFVCLMGTAMWLEGRGLVFGMLGGLLSVFALLVIPITPDSRTHVTEFVIVSYLVYIAMALFLGAQLRKNRLSSSFDTFVLERHLSLLASVDPLTGLLNRAGWQRHVDDWCDSASATQPASILYLDLDHFKSINDKLGHPEGDRILCLTAKLARTILRDRDVLGRFGGEEFVAFLPDTTLGQAAEVAERLREAIEEEGASQPMPLTVSVGVAKSWGREGVSDALRRADMALLSAKRAGRNRVLVDTLGAPL